MRNRRRDGTQPTARRERSPPASVCTPMPVPGAKVRLKRNWRSVRQGKPGHRFVDHYERSARTRGRGGTLARVLGLSLAILALAIGVVLSVIPGPAIPFFLVAGALLASEFRFAARFMDGLELRLRAIFAWGLEHWKRLPGFARIVLAILSLAASAGSAWLLYRWLVD